MAGWPLGRSLPFTFNVSASAQEIGRWQKDRRGIRCQLDSGGVLLDNSQTPV
jgi:hypothetical protein